MAFRFRRFKVYGDAIDGYKWIVEKTKHYPPTFFHLRDQIQRAALSVALNIAEGSAKPTDADFNRYIGNALGSTNEVAAALEVAYEVRLIIEDDLKVGIQKYETICNQLGGLSKTLKVHKS